MRVYMVVLRVQSCRKSSEYLDMIKSDVILLMILASKCDPTSESVINLVQG